MVDIFITIQKVQDTGINLRVDEEQCRIKRGSKRQAGGSAPPSRTTCQGFYYNKYCTIERYNILPQVLWMIQSSTTTSTVGLHSIIVLLYSTRPGIFPYKNIQIIKKMPK